MKKIKKILQQRKYELLFAALIQHLFVGIIVRDIPFYILVLWPVNMVILGLASVGVFIEKGRIKNIIKNILTVLVIALPVMLPFFKGVTAFMFVLNISYVVFFFFIFYEIFRFLINYPEASLEVLVNPIT